MKYLVHYYVEGFGGQKEYFKTYEEAVEFVNNKITSYAEDVEIVELCSSEDRYKKIQYIVDHYNVSDKEAALMVELGF